VRPAIEWAVRAEDGRTVADVLAKLAAIGGDARGRVFVNGRRASAEDPVEPGDRLELFPEHEGDENGVRLLGQRDGVLLVVKPAGLPSEPTHRGESSVVTVVAAMLGGATVHAASRLDVGVSGVMVCCLGGDAARRVERFRAAGQLARAYLGIGAGTLAGDGIWDAALATVRDRAGRAFSQPRRDGRGARTRYRVLGTTPTATLLLLEPETGRMHQLRAHAALAGVPLFGDRRYGGPSDVVAPNGSVRPLDRIALHCARVSMPGLEAEAPLPDELRELWRTCGGDDQDHRTR
jgi:23S rRNA-/tRNA-specific pseudouridylate synthase